MCTIRAYVGSPLGIGGRGPTPHQKHRDRGAAGCPARLALLRQSWPRTSASWCLDYKAPCGPAHTESAARRRGLIATTAWSTSLPGRCLLHLLQRLFSDPPVAAIRALVLTFLEIRRNQPHEGVSPPAGAHLSDLSAAVSVFTWASPHCQVLGDPSAST